MAEYGIVLRKGATELRRKLPELLEDAENGFTPQMRELLQRQYQRLAALDDELIWYDNRQRKNAAGDSVCQRLLSIPGFGPLVSLAVKSWMGDGKQFKRGRDASAALGLVHDNSAQGATGSSGDHQMWKQLRQINADTWCPSCFVQIRRQNGST